MKNKGVTLISLVVSIVVLLILAGITIGTIFNDNGIIKKAQEAANATEEATKNDQAEINGLLNEMDSIINGIGGGNVPVIGNIKGKITWSTVSATLTLTADVEGVTIQYQKGGINGSWTTGTIVTGLRNRSTVFARLTDGKNYGGRGKHNNTRYSCFTNSNNKFKWNKYNNSRNILFVSSWRNISVNDIYTNCLNYNKTLNSHMMKNDEWGAVAYLSKSKYGKQNKEVWINNSSNFITGSAGNSTNANADTGTTNDYTSAQGVKASTTGTVHGVYDMSGGAWEYIAAYVKNGHDNLTKNGASLANSNDAKTKNVYSTGSSDSYENNYNANSGKYGDVVYETSKNGDASNSSWYGDYSYFPNRSSPFFSRGGCYNSDARGMSKILCNLKKGL